MLLLVVLVACDKGKEKNPSRPRRRHRGDGLRRWRAARRRARRYSGYKPERIVGKPGEKLNLVFKRTVEGECLAKLKTPDGKVIDLPMNTPVEVAVTVPQQGEPRSRAAWICSRARSSRSRAASYFSFSSLSATS